MPNLLNSPNRQQTSEELIKMTKEEQSIILEELVQKLLCPIKTSGPEGTQMNIMENGSAKGFPFQWIVQCLNHLQATVCLVWRYNYRDRRGMI